jgi:hypothetical protein
MLRYRSIASLQRTVSTPPLVDFRAPRIWIFLSSLQEAFFSTLLSIAAENNVQHHSAHFSSTRSRDGEISDATASLLSRLPVLFGPYMS